MAEYVELFIDQGADFYTTINLFDDATNAAQNLDGIIVTSSLRRSFLSPNASANLICSVTNTQTGEITMRLDKANTSNLRAGQYLFDVKIYNPEQDYSFSRLIEGVIFVIPAVTR